MYRFLVAAFAVYAILRCYSRYREGHVSTRRVVVWVLFWAGVVAVSWIPQATDRMSKTLGIEQGANLFFFVSILGLTYLLFVMYTRLEAMRCEITDLVRKLALSELDKPGSGDSQRPRTPDAGSA